MALTVNGARLQWRAYEFGVRVTDENIPGQGIQMFDCESKEDADAMQADYESRGYTAQVMFCAVYVTGWEETL